MSELSALMFEINSASLIRAHIVAFVTMIGFAFQDSFLIGFISIFNRTRYKKTKHSGLFAASEAANNQ